MAGRAAVHKRPRPSRRVKAAGKPSPDGGAGPARTSTRTPVKVPLAQQFYVAVDRQLKSGYATYQEAEEAALAVKARHPRLDVTVYDAKDDRHTAVELPKA